MDVLCADPDFRRRRAVLQFAAFGLAIDRRFTNKHTGEREADFINAQLLAAVGTVSLYFHKGSMILWKEICEKILH